MSSTEEHNNMNCNIVIKQEDIKQEENGITFLLNLENRLTKLEEHNTLLKSQLDVMARQLGLTPQQLIRPPFAIHPNSESPVINGDVAQEVPTDRFTKVSSAIRQYNVQLASEGFRWNENYRSVHNVHVRSKIFSYVIDLQSYDIPEGQLSKKIYNFFDNQRTAKRRSAERAAERRKAGRRNARRHAKHQRRYKAFQLHETLLQESYLGGEALLQLKYMSDEETDDEYDGEIGKRVLVRRPQWRNERANELLRLLDELQSPSDAIRLIKAVGDVCIVSLNDDEQQQLEGWIIIP